MSILNCSVSERRALVAVDTHVQKNGGASTHGPKLFVVPHANLVLAVRGDVIFGNELAGHLHLGPVADFDEAAAVMPSLLDHAFAAYSRLRKEHGDVPWSGSEIALVGWSKRAARMQGIRWESWPGDQLFKVTPIEPWSLSPNASWPELPAAPDTAAKMEALARDQLRFIRTHFPGAAIGGRLLVAEITRDAVNVRTVADLEAGA
jgi:hypothetical protein